MNQPNHQSKARTCSEKEQQVRRLYSQDLFKHHKELVIEHAGQEYRLRITRQNKLILTK
ncbi:MAG: hemin uptake protein HemP [Candidatus Polarisedimenticolaceae bacterium]|nr:hemin uptake protein HemP [Candidatus Polarisedimenticolaceae bacterium]